MSRDDESRGTDAISIKRYMEYLFRVLEYGRIWPTESFSLFKILLSMAATIFFISTNVILLFSEIVALTMNINMKLFANIIGVIGMHAVGLIKWCYCIRKNRKIVDIMIQLEKCHVLCRKLDSSEEGYRIYRNKLEHITKKYSNYFAWSWTFICTYGVLFWCSTPLVEEWSSYKMNPINYTFKQRNLPYIAWYPLNTNDIHTYAYLYIMQVLGGLSSGFGIVFYDSFYVSMLLTSCAQFQYINIIMMKIDFDNMPETELVLQDKLKKCADCHGKIMKFLEMLQTFSGPTMFVQCIETLVVLCLVSLEASIIKIAFDMACISRLWNMFQYFSCAALQFYIFCLSATQVKHLGLQIADSVYSCGWELVYFEKGTQADLKKELKQSNIGQLLQTIIMQAQKPIVLTGGPFYVLSLETFRIIICMALSNAVILRTLSDAEEMI